MDVGQLLNKQILRHGRLKWVFAFVGLSFLAGCARQTSSLDNVFGPSATSSTSDSVPSSLIPNDSDAVTTSNLPPINGRINGGYDVNDMPQDGQISIADGVATQSSIVDLNAQNDTHKVVSRILSNPLQKEQLIGGWTFLAGSAQCRLFLTLTAKSNRYRASTPGCQAPQLKSVDTWSLDGGKVVLFNRSGRRLATFVRSGNRFVGALSDGTGASLAG